MQERGVVWPAQDLRGALVIRGLGLDGATNHKGVGVTCRTQPSELRLSPFQLSSPWTAVTGRPRAGCCRVSRWGAVCRVAWLPSQRGRGGAPWPLAKGEGAEAFPTPSAQHPDCLLDGQPGPTSGPAGGQQLVGAQSLLVAMGTRRSRLLPAPQHWGLSLPNLLGQWRGGVPAVPWAGGRGLEGLPAAGARTEWGSPRPGSPWAPHGPPLPPRFQAGGGGSGQGE